MIDDNKLSLLSESAVVHKTIDEAQLMDRWMDEPSTDIGQLLNYNYSQYTIYMGSSFKWSI